jgi:hypothetical protein
MCRSGGNKRRMRAVTNDSNRHRHAATQCCAAQRRHPDVALRRVCAIVAG